MLRKAVTSQKAVKLKNAVTSHVYVILCRFLYQRAVMSQKAVMLQKAVTSQKAVMSQKMVILQKAVIWPRTNNVIKQK